MNGADDPVGAILARQGIDGPWHPLTATGLANRIYATNDVVLRIATDHPEAVEDARNRAMSARLNGRPGCERSDRRGIAAAQPARLP